MNRISVWFGLISYPLYLWHWPILSFLRIIEGEIPHRDVRIIAVLLSIFLAWLTYLLVEKPFRFGPSKTFKTLVLVLVLIFSGLGGLYIQYKGGIPHRLSQSGFKNQQKEIVFSKSDCPLNFELISGCKVIPSKTLRDDTLVIVGDSHVRQAFELISDSFVRRGYSVIGISHGGCPTLFDTNTSNVDNCADVNSELFDYLLSIKSTNLRIYMAGQWFLLTRKGV